MTKKGDLRADLVYPAPNHTQTEKAPQIANGGGSRAYLRSVTKVHRKCRDCKKTCKQSPKVLLIKCPQYEQREKKDGKS